MTIPSVTSIAFATAVIIVAGLIASIIHSILRALLDNRTSKATSVWISRTSQYVIYAAAFYYAFYKILELNFAAMAASAGILGIAVAFSSQQIIQNVIAGLLITIRRPIRLEDYISIGFPDIGISKVKDVNISNNPEEYRRQANIRAKLNNINISHNKLYKKHGTYDKHTNNSVGSEKT